MAYLGGSVGGRTNYKGMGIGANTTGGAPITPPPTGLPPGLAAPTGGIPTIAAPTGGGGGGVQQGFPPTFGGAQAGGAQASINYQPATPYSPYGGGGQLQDNLGAMSNFAQGMMDPNSDYYKKLQAQMTSQLGLQSEAQQRAGALRSAYGGFGAGAGAEQMMNTADIGRAGLEAQGQASAGLALQAPMVGMQALQSTFSPGLGLGQLGEQSRQFGAGLGQQAQQFGAGMGMQQQQLAAQQGFQQAQLTQQSNMANQQAALEQQRLMAQMAMNYGGI